ncbi:DUF22 domain-containing protein [Methanobacterium alcaliphilum]|uniref:DUF22 domain-containing protein n=1 Tax=Methanobacterium alcaliphilum TaxID=392018 RepID=UPI00200A2FD2|nr:DUF22 domain-containing protein [Methanobacterium alcaliphilum]MCK9150979.1 DUF22 domain-containing protein [Methanobacterium alcaliphilum]
MVRILTRLGEVKKEMEQYESELVDFNIGTISGNLRAIIADEDIDIKSGDVTPIKINKISIPGNHIIYMCAYAAHHLGHPIAVGEETHLPISMDRHADYTTFVAANDGTVKKDDLLGVVIILPISLTHK